MARLPIKHSFGIIFIYCVLFLFSSNSFASGFRYFSDYLYITDRETTYFNEIIWFYQADTLYGRIHSNDRIGIKNRPIFYHPITSSQSGFMQGVGYNPWLASEPRFNFPYADFPDRASALRANAQLQGNFVENDSINPRQFILSGSGEHWFYEAWEVGLPYHEELVIDQGDIEYSEELALFFDGDLYLSGDNIQGSSTIGASGNIFLTDNITYADFDIDEMPDTLESEHKLGIVSERNIIISDTEANGRGNGDMYRANHDSAHIVITAAILALNDRVTFEHQNDIGDAYRWCDNPGRSQDERGAIWLRGSVAQKRRGYVHRSNCGGTGYDKKYHYDYRLLDNPPPFYPGIEWDGMTKYGTQTWQDTVINWDQESTPRYIFDSHITIGPGTEINITGIDSAQSFLELIATDLRIDATLDNPARINVHTVEEEIRVDLFPHFGVSRNDEGLFADEEWTGLYLTADELLLNAPVKISGSILEVDKLNVLPAVTAFDERQIPLDISHSTIRVSALYSLGAAENFGSFTYSELEGRLISRFSEIRNVTFARYLEDFPVVRNERSGLEIRNTAFAGQRGALVMGDPATISYSGYFDFANEDPFSENIEVGEGMLVEVDPMYSDIENGDYTLMEGSPYINAGDLLTEWDPDGTPPDIGAYFHNMSTAREKDKEKAIVSTFKLQEPYPNPFNAALTVPFQISGRSEISVHLFNLLGQEVWSMSEYFAAGSHKLTVSGGELVSGLYLLKIESEEFSYSKKVLLLK